MLSNCGVGEDSWECLGRQGEQTSQSQEINPKYSLEEPTLKLKLQYFIPHDVKSWLNGKDPDAGKDWRQKEKRVAEDETVR